MPRYCVSVTRTLTLIGTFEVNAKNGSTAKENVQEVVDNVISAATSVLSSVDIVDSVTPQVTKVCNILDMRWLEDSDSIDVDLVEEV
jgi:orotate phosphoribosyltransferase